MIEIRCVSLRAQSRSATGTSAISTAARLRRSPRTRAVSPLLHATHFQLPHLIQEACMTVYQQVLWMFVNIRLLGRQPRSPLSRDSLTHYAAALEIQYSRICEHLGTARRHEATAIAWKIIGLLGLIQAAEPLPPLLLVLLERHEGASSSRFPLRGPTCHVCSSGAQILSLSSPTEV